MLPFLKKNLLPLLGQPVSQSGQLVLGIIGDIRVLSEMELDYNMLLMYNNERIPKNMEMFDTWRLTYGSEIVITEIFSSLDLILEKK